MLRLLSSIAMVLAPQVAEWKRVEAPLALEFPRDHGAHLDHRTEWWYATGEVASDAGARFGVQLTLFRQGLDPSSAREGESQLRARHGFAGHLAIVDLATGRIVHAERARRGLPGLAEASESSLDVRLDGWSMRFDELGVLRLDAADRASGLGLALELVPEKPLVLHGASGVSTKGSERGNASVYVSWTRLTASGSVTFGGATHRVRGGAWFDHEWGTTQLGEGVVGWDWFGLRLDDGRELMLYRLRRADGSTEPASAVTLVERDGSARSIPLARFALESRATWTSPRTGASYPAAWRLASPDEALELVIAPRAADCELDATRSTGVIYWEGPVVVTGSASGSGYAELTGYASALPGALGDAGAKK